MKLSVGFTIIMVAVALWIPSKIYNWDTSLVFFLIGIGIATLNKEMTLFEKVKK